MITREKILLVGKKQGLIEQIEVALKLHEEWRYCRISFVGEIARALDELSVKSYDLLLIDCESYTTSPLEILIQLRAINKKTPLILLNKAGLEKTAINCLKHGADYYLIYDTNWQEDLVHVMDTVLREHEQRQAALRKITRLEDENMTLKKEALVDSPTHFYSVDHFNSLLSRELKRAMRHDLDLSCLILDVKMDGHKNFATEEADGIYEIFSTLLKSIVRSSDIWARMGENRFAALLPHTHARSAKKALARIESEITGNSILLEKTQKPIKINWGVANFDKKKIKNENEFLLLAESSLSKLAH